MDTIIKIENLEKQYQDFKLDNITFSVPKGCIMGLVGENGAGKSTTINCLLDLVQKDGGKITFWEKELSDDPSKLKEDIGVVFDGINFYETLTVKKIEKISKSAYKQWDSNIFIGI